jgi:SGNH hydrolase-like domain, acetyltransferase AlgX
LAWRWILSFTVVLCCAVFLIDLFTPRSLTVGPAHWVILGLIATLLSQLEMSRTGSLNMPVLALAGISLIIGVVAIECLLVLVLAQIVTPTTEREFLHLMRKSDHMGWVPWPQPIAEQKPAGTYRFIGLADSLGIWGGPESNYFRLLERLLQADGQVQLINLSIDGYEPSHQLRVLPFGMRYSPDLVVHGFFVGNDFTLSDHRIYKFLGFRTHRTRDDVWYRPRDFMLRAWTETVWRIAAETRAVAREKQTGISTFSRETFLAMQHFRLNHWGRGGEANRRSLESVFPVLDEIRRIAESGGARYVLVIHPDQTQVDQKLRQELVASFGLRELDFDLDFPQRVMLEYCTTRRVTCLDLLPAFRAHALDGDLYLPRDTHYNEAGRRLAADGIRDFLAAHAIGPESKRSWVVNP